MKTPAAAGVFAYSGRVNIAYVSTWIVILALAAVSLFQIALILGAPMGEYAFGGQNPGKLPGKFRAMSGVTLLVYLGIVGHMLAQIEILPRMLPDDLNRIANWVIFGLNILSFVMNSISRSKKERDMWVPVALMLSVASFFVARG
ncbi:MAG: hypothetical protein RL645_1048 [Actinomycetota bacterium]